LVGAKPSGMACCPNWPRAVPSNSMLALAAASQFWYRPVSRSTLVAPVPKGLFAGSLGSGGGHGGSLSGGPAGSHPWPHSPWSTRAEVRWPQRCTDTMWGQTLGGNTAVCHTQCRHNQWLAHRLSLFQLDPPNPVAIYIKT